MAAVAAFSLICPGETFARTDNSEFRTSAAAGAPTASCSPASGTITGAEDGTLGFSFTYQNPGNPDDPGFIFSTTISANPVFGPFDGSVFDSATLKAGYGVTRSVEEALGEPGSGTYAMKIQITAQNRITATQVLAECDFSLVVTPRAPAVVALPVISGTAQSGQQLSCSSGTWDRPVTTASYRWLDDTGTELGAGSTYVPTDDLEGHRLSCEVTASNSGGSATARSGVTAPVLPRAPVNAAAPTVSGIPRDGDQLACDPGRWTGKVRFYEYAWLHQDAGAAPVATSDRYTAQPSDVGHALVCRVTATNIGGPTTATSTPTEPIRVRFPTNVSPPAIAPSRVANVGQLLTCQPGTWLPDPGVVATMFQFTWTRQPNGTLGEAGPSVLLSQTATTGQASAYRARWADFDHNVFCTVTGANDGGSGDTVWTAVRILSAGAGSWSLTAGSLTLRAPRRVALSAERQGRLIANAAEPGMLKLSLRASPGAGSRGDRTGVLLGTTRPLAAAGRYVINLRLSKRLRPGRFTLVASFRPRGGHRSVTRTAPFTIVR